jgi:hypothetical protein
MTRYEQLGIGRHAANSHIHQQQRKKKRTHLALSKRCLDPTLFHLWYLFTRFGGSGRSEEGG